MRLIIIILLSIPFSVFSQNSDSMNFLIKGVEEYGKKNYEGAINYYDSAIQLNPNLAIAYVLKAESITNSGIAGEMRLPTHDPKVYDAALTLYNKAIGLDPKDSENYSSRGLLNTFHQKYELAVEDFTFALNNTADFDQMFNYLSDRGSAYARLKNYEKAIADYNSALSLKPNEYSIYLNISSVLIDQEKFEKAEEFLKKAIVQAPDNSDVYSNYGLLRIKQEDYIGAIELLEKSQKLTPDDPLCLGNLGFAYFKDGEQKKGIEYIEKSLELYPSNSYAYKYLGLAFIDLKKRKKACDYFTKAKELGYEKSYDNEVNELIEQYCNK